MSGYCGAVRYVFGGNSSWVKTAGCQTEAEILGAKYYDQMKAAGQQAEDREITSEDLVHLKEKTSPYGFEINELDLTQAHRTNVYQNVPFQEELVKIAVRVTSPNIVQILFHDRKVNIREISLISGSNPKQVVKDTNRNAACWNGDLMPNAVTYDGETLILNLTVYYKDRVEDLISRAVNFSIKMPAGPLPPPIQFNCPPQSPEENLSPPNPGVRPGYLFY